jgi:hypothetical protein
LTDLYLIFEISNRAMEKTALLFFALDGVFGKNKCTVCELAFFNMKHNVPG